MAATTSLLGLVTPTQGDLSGTWGNTVNNGITEYVDIAVAGTLTLTNDGAVTLANTLGSASASLIVSSLTGAGTVTAQFAIVKVTGTLTVAKVVTGPSYSKTYTVVNSATGGIVTFKASGQTGVSIAVGETAFVYFNGTDYVKIVGTATAGAAGGSTTQVQYNNAGVLAGITGATTNGTALTLVAPNLGSPATVGTMPAFTLGGTVSGGGNQINNVIIGTTTPLAGAFTTLSATGVATFSAGTLSLPAITTTGDTNTGIFFPAADSVATTVGGVEGTRLTSTGLGIGTSSPTSKLTVAGAISVNTGVANLDALGLLSGSSGNRIGLSLGRTAQEAYIGIASTSNSIINGDVAGDLDILTTTGNIRFSTNAGASLQATLDTSGNLGLGVTPSAWSSITALQIKNGFIGGLNNRIYVGANNYYDGSNSRYIATDFATRYYQNAGQHIWETAASGTAGNAITFTQAMTLDASGNLGIGTTTMTQKLNVEGNVGTKNGGHLLTTASNTNAGGLFLDSSGSKSISLRADPDNDASGTYIGFATDGTERARIDSSGNLLVGKTASDVSVAGTQIESTGTVGIVRNAAVCLIVNRLTDDGTLVSLRQASTEEGTISVSGTTVSYNGGHLSRWAQMLTTPELFKGTVMSNLDEMNVYTKDGQPVANEQLNKVKVSDTEGDVNVAGVFVNWSHDEDHNVDEINMAMTGDMIIRIAQGVTVVRGDLLMSAGDGTAKPQGDDIVRSKTVAKVTSNHITCTYADGSYCVPCVLMAC